MSLGDNISFLSTTTALDAGFFFKTASIYVGEYSNIIFTGKVQTASNLFLVFSGDGINDSVNYPAIPLSANVEFCETVLIKTKFLRLTLVPNGAAAQTYTYLHAYGSVRPIVTETTINTPPGGLPVSIASPNPLPVTVTNVIPPSPPPSIPVVPQLVDTPHTIFSTDFYHFEDRDSIITSNTPDGYPLTFGGNKMLISKVYGNTVISAMQLMHFETGFNSGHYLQLRINGENVGQKCVIRSERFTSTHATGPIYFTSTFSTNGGFFADMLRQRAIVGLISGDGYIESSVGPVVPLDPMIAIGCWTETPTSSTYEIDIVIYSGNEVATRVFPQSTWNVDRADGTQGLPAMSLISSSLISVRIILLKAGNDGILIQLASPLTGEYVTVHKIQNSSEIAFYNQGFTAFFMNGFEHPAVTPLKTLRLHQMDLQQSSGSISGYPHSSNSIHYVFEVPAASSVNLVAYLNPPTSTSWLGAKNRSSVIIDCISVVAYANQNNDYPPIVLVKKIAHRSQLGGGPWNPLDQINTPLQNLTTPSYTQGLYPPPHQIGQFFCPGRPNSLLPTHYYPAKLNKSTSHDASDWILDPGATLLLEWVQPAGPFRTYSLGVIVNFSTFG